MLSEKIILELSGKWQTTEVNVVREYLQHLFLRSFYKFEELRKILFKGIKACLTRQKSRDFCDIYFLLRKGILGEFLKDYQRPFLTSLNYLDSASVLKELKPLLPASHQILVRSLKENLKSELEKFI